MVAFSLETASLYAQSAPTQDRDTATAYQWILITTADNDAPDAGTKNGFRAGPRAALMATRLQGHVQGGALCLHPERGQGFDFCVGQARPTVKASGKNLAVLNQERANDRIGLRRSSPLFG
jgi:hypothetical protein